MPLQLTQKEQQLLKDQQNHEKICIEKYQQYASKAQDPQLKQLFTSFAEKETQHLNTINSMLSGQVPMMQQGQAAQQSQAAQPTASSSTSLSAAVKQADAMLCKDMLMTEKFVSSAYDTSIFECSDTNVRQALNHIQKEEQEHGEGLYNYLSSTGMYNA